MIKKYFNEYLYEYLKIVSFLILWLTIVLFINLIFPDQLIFPEKFELFIRIVYLFSKSNCWNNKYFIVINFDDFTKFIEINSI